MNFAHALQKEGVFRFRRFVIERSAWHRSSSDHLAPCARIANPRAGGFRLKIAAIVRASLTPPNSAKAEMGRRAGVVSGVARAGRNVFRTFRWRHWFVGIQNGKALGQGRGSSKQSGVIVVVSQAARNARRKQAKRYVS